MAISTRLGPRKARRGRLRPAPRGEGRRRPLGGRGVRGRRRGLEPEPRRSGPATGRGAFTLLLRCAAAPEGGEGWGGGAGWSLDLVDQVQQRSEGLAPSCRGAPPPLRGEGVERRRGLEPGSRRSGPATGRGAFTLLLGRPPPLRGEGLGRRRGLESASSVRSSKGSAGRISLRRRAIYRAASISAPGIPNSSSTRVR